MRTVILILAVLLFGGVAFAQHPDMRFKETSVTGAWDSAYVLVAFGGLKVNILNLSSADTLKYFFGKTKADSTTATVYKLYPGKDVAIEIPVAGDNFRCLFRRSTNAAALSAIEQTPYNEK